jgi:DNA-binding NarL/FixJ family response regulator
MRIVPVEDGRKGALILSRGLGEEGFTVDLAGDGSEAEKVLKTVPYDLVILDWLLPGKQGIDVCRDLRRRDASMPILMLKPPRIRPWLPANLRHSCAATLWPRLRRIPKRTAETRSIRHDLGFG